jgi:hypothetical protein
VWCVIGLKSLRERILVEAAGYHGYVSSMLSYGIELILWGNSWRESSLQDVSGDTYCLNSATKFCRQIPLGWYLPDRILHIKTMTLPQTGVIIPRWIKKKTYYFRKLVPYLVRIIYPPVGGVMFSVGIYTYTLHR